MKQDSPKCQKEKKKKRHFFTYCVPGFVVCSRYPKIAHRSGPPVAESLAAETTQGQVSKCSGALLKGCVSHFWGSESSLEGWIGEVSQGESGTVSSS